MRIDRDLVQMTVKDVLACSTTSWYDKFKGSTLKSILIPMPPEVLAYMQDGGTLVLPEGSQPEQIYNIESNDDDSDDEDQIDWDANDDDTPKLEAPKLEEFNKKIEETIRKLGGKVFPKLNWSSPKDATWIALNNSLQCSTPGDIYQLLKSSTFIAHDLNSPFKDCSDREEVDTTVDYYIVLRRWVDMNPAYEFRCFVKAKNLIGICQRDVSQSYSCIGAEKENIRNDIIRFYHENIENRFPLDNYTFDVYREKEEKVYLVDFNPYGVSTDALLFNWRELKVLKPLPESETESDQDSINEDMEGMLITEIDDSNKYNGSDNVPEFRFITRATGVQPSPYMQYGVPVDFVDMCNGLDPYKLIDFIQMTTQGQADEDATSEEEVDS